MVLISDQCQTGFWRYGKNSLVPTANLLTNNLAQCRTCQRWFFKPQVFTSTNHQLVIKIGHIGLNHCLLEHEHCVITCLHIVFWISWLLTWLLTRWCVLILLISSFYIFTTFPINSLLTSKLPIAIISNSTSCHRQQASFFWESHNIPTWISLTRGPIHSAFLTACTLNWIYSLKSQAEAHTLFSNSALCSDQE